MAYYLNLFTGKTWQEFQQAGAGFSGFRQKSLGRARVLRPGDILLCYMVGVKRWVGLLEVQGEAREETTRIFAEELFPVRVAVHPLLMLSAEHGVPMESFRGRLSFYPNSPGMAWTARLRGSIIRYSDEDGRLIEDAIRQAAQTPVVRPVRRRELERPANLYRVTVQAPEGEHQRVVVIPDTENDPDPQRQQEPASSDETTHTEIQWRLLDLGSRMGLDVWAPKRDRGRIWRGKRIAEIGRLRDRLPTQFDESTNRTIEEIDVLWLQGQTIVAAFEVEHTTSIFSGLLRMSDLLTMQPNIAINLFITSPDDRLGKFRNEVARPTFALRTRPLHSLCRFLPYSRLCERLEEARNVIRFLRPEFLDEIAVAFDPEGEVSPHV